MKAVLGALVLLAALLVYSNGYAECTIVDSKGREMKSADCFGLLLRVETDKFIYAGICLDGADECDNGFRRYEGQVLPLYFTAAFCQSEPLMYSPARSLGYLFEPVQYFDGSGFYYPEWKTVATGGSALRSYWDGYTCYDSGGIAWWDDRTVFAPVAVKQRADFARSIQPPFRIPR